MRISTFNFYLLNVLKLTLVVDTHAAQIERQQEHTFNYYEEIHT